MKITYNASVFTSAGWRSVTITAKVSKISEKRGKVCEVLLIDGELPTGYLSRTGAKRQTYNAHGVGLREVGKIKILSKCDILEA